MLWLLLYTTMIYLSGLAVFCLLKFAKILKLHDFGFLELSAVSFNLGILLNYIVFFIISLVGIKITFAAFLPAIILSCLSVILLISKKVTFKSGTKKSRFEIFFLILLTISSLFLLIEAVTHNVTYPDEYAAWTALPKIYFSEGSLRYTVDYGTVKYPPFLTSLSAGFYFFTGRLDEVNVRALPAIILYINLLGMYSYTKRRKFSACGFLTFAVLILTMYNNIFYLGGSSYADLPFACIYTFAVLYYLELFDNVGKDKSYCILSLIYFAMLCLIKIDGIYMLVFNAAIIFLYVVLKRKDLRPKAVICSIIPNLFAPLLYVAYLLFNKFLCTNTTRQLQREPVPEYTLEMLKNLFNQQFDDIVWMVLIVLILVYSAAVIYKNKFNRNNSFETLGLFIYILANIAFLAFSFIIKFGNEAPLAASYIRYITRAVFIAVFLLLNLRKLLRSDAGEARIA